MVDSNKQYGYWIPDQPAATNGNTGGTNTLHRMDLRTLQVTKYSQRVTGDGWMGALAPDGTMMFSTISDVGAVGAGVGYIGNCDQYVRLYAMNPSNQTLYEVTRFQRTDATNPSGSCQIDRWCTAFGVMFGWDSTNGLVGGDPIGYVEKVTHIP
jgi:hypothetical protein